MSCVNPSTTSQNNVDCNLFLQITLSNNNSPMNISVFVELMNTGTTTSRSTDYYYIASP